MCIRDSPTNNPRKLPQLDNRSLKSVYDNASYGPTFGYGHDLRIAHSANMKSRSWLGITYTAPSGKRRHGDTFLTGSNYFRANEVETFYETAE